MIKKWWRSKSYDYNNKDNITIMDKAKISVPSDIHETLIGVVWHEFTHSGSCDDMRMRLLAALKRYFESIKNNETSY